MVVKGLTTAWTWLDNEEIRGLTLDVDTGTLRWYDQIGCHCTDEEFWPQSLAEFRQQGTPPLISELPADVAAELDEIIVLIGQR